MSDLVVTDAKKTLLERLKRRGSMTAAELAAELALTDVAVRQHLATLEVMGLVVSAPRPQEEGKPAGRGRPSASWSLTEWQPVPCSEMRLRC